MIRPAARRSSTRAAQQPLSLAEEQAASTLSLLEQRHTAAALRLSGHDGWHSSEAGAGAPASVAALASASASTPAPSAAVQAPAPRAGANGAVRRHDADGALRHRHLDQQPGLELGPRGTAAGAGEKSQAGISGDDYCSRDPRADQWVGRETERVQVLDQAVRALQTAYTRVAAMQPDHARTERACAAAEPRLERSLAALRDLVSSSAPLAPAAGAVDYARDCASVLMADLSAISCSAEQHWTATAQGVAALRAARSASRAAPLVLDLRGTSALVHAATQTDDAAIKQVDLYLCVDDSLASFPRVLKHVTSRARRHGVAVSCIMLKHLHGGGATTKTGAEGAAPAADHYHHHDVDDARSSAGATHGHDYSARPLLRDQSTDTPPPPPSPLPRAAPSLFLLLYNAVGQSRVQWGDVVSFVQQQRVPVGAACRLAVVRDKCSSALVPSGDASVALSAFGLRSLLSMDYHYTKGFRMSKDNDHAYDAIAQAVVEQAASEGRDVSAPDCF